MFDLFPPKYVFVQSSCWSSSYSEQQQLAVPAIQIQLKILCQKRGSLKNSTPLRSSSGPMLRRFYLRKNYFILAKRSRPLLLLFFDHSFCLSLILYSTRDQSYKASTIVIYDSAVVITSKLPTFTTLNS